MLPIEPLSDPKISVIIPAYNAERFLGQTIQSVLSQTAPPTEIVVIDDGSTDSTSRVASSFGGIVRCIPKANGGPASARNLGIRAVNADWIAFLDADDQWLPNKLEVQLHHARRTGADLISSDALLVGGSHQGTTWMRQVKLWPRLQRFLGENLLPNPFEMLLTVGCFLLPSMVLVRRNSLLHVGLFDERLHGTEDIDLWLRLALKCKMAIHPSPLITRQIHEGNITGNARRMIVETIKVWDKLLELEDVSQNPYWLSLVRSRKAADYRHLGHWLLRDDQRIEARRAWRKSLQSSFSWSVEAFWLATFLPEPLFRTMQSLRKSFFRQTPPDARPPDATVWKSQRELNGRSH